MTFDHPPTISSTMTGSRAPAKVRTRWQTQNRSRSNLAWGSPCRSAFRASRAAYDHLLLTLCAYVYAPPAPWSSDKVVAARRSLCGHEDASKDPEPAWDSPPFSPSGAVSGKVMDSAMAAEMSFIARAGHPCGEDFIAAPFLAAHPEFNWQAPVLHDMKAGPWSTFTVTQHPAS